MGEDFQPHWPKAGGISIPICGINDQIQRNWTTPRGIGKFHRGWSIIPLHGNGGFHWDSDFKFYHPLWNWKIPPGVVYYTTTWEWKIPLGVVYYTE